MCPIRGWCGKNINREHRDMAQKRIPVRPENSDKIIHVNVQVPSIPPTDTQSEVIQVSYYLKVIEPFFYTFFIQIFFSFSILNSCFR